RREHHDHLVARVGRGPSIRSRSGRCCGARNRTTRSWSVMAIENPQQTDTAAERFERLVDHEDVHTSRRESIGAGLALFALVVGLPVMLLVLAGPPRIPTEFPGMRELA